MTTTGAFGMVSVRCEGGTSHNPAESVTIADAEAVARSIFQVLNDFPGIP
jgi:allantoate deiminase